MAQRMLGDIALVQCREELLDTAMRGLIEKFPRQAAVVLPFGRLSEFAPHEEEFFAGHAIHIGEQ